ncbi:hypothetical protein NAEX_09064 [Nannocystis exedens]|nr:hypothetical protein NAEX_09064 [Nannocystis exedens]
MNKGLTCKCRRDECSSCAAWVGPRFVKMGRGRGHFYYDIGELERYRAEGQASRGPERPQAQELPSIPPLLG